MMDKFFPEREIKRKEKVLFRFRETSEILSRIYDGGAKP